ncbi:MAG: heme ABC transporter ATP-binding protein [Acidimicrobiia bacterium]|nr:heme ABC transporter ATP-binding protein [Acidimicrobiia bacterium]
MNSSLRADGITHRIGSSSLIEDATLAAGAGEIVALVGPNGAGKTTMLRILAGDLRPSAGRASISDVDVSRATVHQLAELRAFLGPQGVAPNPFTVREVVAMGRHPHRRTTAQDESAIIEMAMRSTDVAHLAARSMASLSTGELQRVGLARVLAQQTPVLLLDEPTSALDIGHQETVMGVLRSAADEGATIVAALHDLNLAAAHANRIVLLDRGRTVASGAPGDVLTASGLSAVYGQPMTVIPHPHRDCLLVLTLDR